MALAGALREQEIAHHRDLVIFRGGILRTPRDAHAAGRRKPLRHQTGKIRGREPCPLGHRAVLHGRCCQNRGQYMPVETEIIVNDGIGRVTPGQHTVGRGSDMFTLVRQARQLQRRQR